MIPQMYDAADKLARNIGGKRYLCVGTDEVAAENIELLVGLDFTFLQAIPQFVRE